MSPAEVIADGADDAVDALITTDLYSVQNALSGGDGEQSVRECGLVIRRPVVYDLDPGDFPAMARRRDASRLQFVLVHFRFDLEPPAGSRRYLGATFQVALDGVEARASAMHPPLLTTAADVERSRSFTLGPTMAFEGIGEFSLGELRFGRTFRYTELRPTIAPSGEGHSTFSWAYTPHDGEGLVPCSRATFAVVELPRDVEELDVTFSGSAMVQRRVAGIRLKFPSAHRPRRARMNVREGTFVEL